ncbi:MAG TPA: substrate-binding domain-containing protein [Burkholderiales bacterium]|nr:substrate-binding domain-containing protein [Burkholderiales bacterium]
MTLRVDFAITWLAADSLSPAQGAQLMALLRKLARSSSLRQAARDAGLSYRFAWGLLTAVQRDLGRPLVELRRGRGAALTGAGRRLLALGERVDSRLRPVLERLAAEADAELGLLRGEAAARLSVHASHDLALAELRAVCASGGLRLEIEFQGSEACLAALRRRQCEVAGFHFAELPGEADGMPAWLRSGERRVVHFAAREQGLIVRRGARIRGLRDLARKGVRFINRQKGSGTRQLTDRLLERAGIDPRSVEGYEREEHTHLAVAATIAAGHADAGFGIRAAAAEYRLGFVPLASEGYYLATSRATYEGAAFRQLLATLRGTEFRTRARKLPGYDLSRAGEPWGAPG